MVPNQRLLSLGGRGLSLLHAFKKADDILYQAVKGISDLIIVPGLINLDFADVKNIMCNMGMALMGTGTASGENRAVEAAQRAISSPLLEDNTIQGAQGILLSITGGPDMSLYEVNEASSLIQAEAHEDANIIFGTVIDENMKDEIRITVIATGFEANSIFQPYKPRKATKVELLQENTAIPESLSRPEKEDGFTVLRKGRKSIITDLEEEMQGVIDFNLVNSETTNMTHNKDDNSEDDEKIKSEATLRKVKHMQKILQKEGLSNKTMKENIDTFEDVPAYIRRNMSLGNPEKTSESKLSKFTLTSDDEEGPVLRENNAYLNDNVD